MNEEALDQLAETKNHVLGLIRSTTAEVFSTMLDMRLTPLPAGADPSAEIGSTGLLAVVGMAGAVSGSGSLRLGETLACRAASRFLMAEYDTVNDEVLDAVSELCNMIVGGLKSSLEEQFGPMALSIPTLVYGQNYHTRSPKLGDRIEARFQYEDGTVSEELRVLICLLTESKNRSYLRELAGFHASLSS